MPRFGAGAKTTAGSTLKPMLSLFANGANNARIYEVGVFNTTATAFDIYLARITAGGTVGAGLAEAPLDNPGAVATSMAFQTHTGGTPTFVDLGYRASIGAAIGAGVVWTFPEPGLLINATAGTTAGVGVVVENGTGQVGQVYFAWTE